MCLRCVCVGGVRICETGFYNLIFICFLCCWSLRVYTGQEVVYMQYTKLWDVILRSGQKQLEELRGAGINQPWQIYCEKYLSPKTGTGWVTVPQKCSKRKKHCSHVYRIKDHMFVCEGCRYCRKIIICLLSTKHLGLMWIKLFSHCNYCHHSSCV